MVTWIVIVMALIFVPVVIGLFLPVRYRGSTVVDFERSMQDVWEALQDVEAHPMTGRMMKTIELLPPDNGRPAWREDMGRGEVITVTTTDYEPPRRMVREMKSAVANMSSRWEYALESAAAEPASKSCRVTLAGTTDIRKGTWHTPIFRFMMVVGGGVKKGLDIQLDMLAATLGTPARRRR